MPFFSQRIKNLLPFFFFLFIKKQSCAKIFLAKIFLAKIFLAVVLTSNNFYTDFIFFFFLFFLALEKVSSCVKKTVLLIFLEQEKFSEKATP